MVYDAGFRGVRPPHGPDQDNYAFAVEYAGAADSIGFTTLLYDAGLQYFYQGYRYYKLTGQICPGYPADDTSLAWIRNEVELHFDKMNAMRTHVRCSPYVDEPEGVGEGAVSIGGVELWENFPAAHPGADAWDYDVVREFAGLVMHLRAYAEKHGRALFIATTTPEIGHECDFVHVDCARIPLALLAKHPSYYYNIHATALLSSYYAEPEFMRKGLAALSSNYSRPVGQIINFFDERYGCRNGCTQQAIADQVAVNRNYSHWHWFFHGDYVSGNYTVPGTEINSATQWKMLCAALRALHVV